MSLPKFIYLNPGSLAQACDLLAAHKDRARLLAGGTDLLIRMQLRAVLPHYLIGLSSIPDLAYCRLNAQNELVIGANAKLAAVGQSTVVREKMAALEEAVRVTATVQIRNMGTVVGNVCNASPSADTSTSLLVYGARAVIVKSGGERELPLDEFFLGPGRTALEPGELVKELVVPVPTGRHGSAYHKLSARSKVDMAMASVCAGLWLDEKNTVIASRIALGAVAPIPKRARKAEQLLQGRVVSENLIQEAAQMAASEAEPIDDLRATATYRRAMVAVVARRVLAQSAQAMNAAPGGTHE